jgi:hypothetical protein
VWLDVARDDHRLPLLAIVEEMVRSEKIALIAPTIVLNEFRRNRDKIAKESEKGLGAHLRLVKEAVERVGGDSRSTKRVLAHLDDVGYKIPIIGGHAVAALNRIEKLLSQSPAIEASPEATLRAAGRALEKKAPFHRGKNAMADAILMETYAECVRYESGTRLAFVTHNKTDFSGDQDQRSPHSDFSGIFTRVKSLYFISLAEALRRADPRSVTESMVEHSWTQEPRRLAEILKAEELLFHQVWYNRHLNLRAKVERGCVEVVETETYPRPLGKGKETVQRDIWKGALKAAAKVEKRFGKQHLGPWDDFEWGMINGKLSALRWLLGDEWDMLDT